MIRVGEQVTWPKLHMIENRFRIERKILRGRQAVRRATMAKANKPTQDTTVDNATPLPGGGMLGTDRVDSSYFGEMSSGAGMASRKGKDAATGGVAPKVPFPAFEQLAVESDAEAGFKAGDERFFKKLSRHSRAASHALATIMGSGEKAVPSVVVWPEGGSTTRIGQPPPSPTSVRKRRWAANSGTGGEHSGSGRARGEIPEVFFSKSSAESLHQNQNSKGPGHPTCTRIPLPVPLPAPPVRVTLVVCQPIWLPTRERGEQGVSRWVLRWRRALERGLLERRGAHLECRPGARAGLAGAEYERRRA
jgi:hypothetical protein